MALWRGAAWTGVAAAAVGAAAVIAACVGDLNEVRNIPYDLAGFSVDLAGGEGGPPGMVAYFPDIQKDVDDLGCPSCHAGGQVPVLLGNPAAMPLTMAELQTNYDNFSAKAMSGATSLILTELLPDNMGGTPHPIKKFTGTSDPVYQRWLAWINAGRPKGF